MASQAASCWPVRLPMEPPPPQAGGCRMLLGAQQSFQSTREHALASDDLQCKWRRECQFPPTGRRRHCSSAETQPLVGISISNHIQATLWRLKIAKASSKYGDGTSKMRTTTMASMAMRPFQVSADCVQPQDHCAIGIGSTRRSRSYVPSSASTSPVGKVRNLEERRIWRRRTTTGSTAGEMQIRSWSRRGAASKRALQACLMQLPDPAGRAPDNMRESLQLKLVMLRAKGSAHPDVNA